MSAKLYLFSLSSILWILSFSECRKKEDMEPITSQTSYPDPDGITYLALGDSYTKAECEAPNNSYPIQLINKFKANGLVIKNKKTIAQTGWRTDDLKSAITNAALEDTFDLVSLLIGVNNQYQGRSIEEYKVQFLDLLQTSIKLARGRKERVFVISIPDYGVTPFGSGNEATIGEQIDLFNAANKQITDSMGVKYFDITPISREAKTDPTLTCSDGLHPSGKMYYRWVNLMLPDLLATLSKP